VDCPQEIPAHGLSSPHEHASVCGPQANARRLRLFNECASNELASTNTLSQVFAPVFLATALVMALCTSCAVRPPAHVAGEKIPCPAKTIGLVRKELPDVHSVKATIDLYFTETEPGRREHFQAGLAAQRPNRVRLNVYAGFMSLVNIAVNGDSLWAFLPSSSILLAGSIDEAAGQALLPLSTGLLLKAVRSVLFPESFCITECKSEQMEKGKCRFEEDSEEGKRIGIVDARTGRLLGLYLVDNDGTERVAVDYRDYRKSGTISFPNEITVSLPANGVKVRLVFHNAVLNREIDENVFRLNDVPSASVRGFGTPWN
jgi:outer membrane lipoprotein-sorting protein